LRKFIEFYNVIKKHAVIPSVARDLPLNWRSPLKACGDDGMYLARANSFFKNKISRKDITIFLRQLETLISSGIDITHACDILIASENNKRLQTLIMSLHKSLTTGLTLSQSLKLYPRCFDELCCHLIFIGEQTGTLAAMLNRVTTQRELSQQFRQQLQKTLFYPTFVTMIAIAITCLMFIEIIPKFAELFTQAHAKLPLLTRSVLAISAWMQTKGLFFILLIGLLALISYCYRKSLKPILDRYLLTFSFINHIYLARFTRHLAITCAAGILITEAIPWIAKTCNNLSYEKALSKIQQDLHKGKPLHLSLCASPYFSKKMIQMVKVGEESGKLGIMLEKIATQCETNIAYIANQLGNFLEPLIMCILGVLIGILVIAMYLPIFKLGAVI